MNKSELIELINKTNNFDNLKELIKECGDLEVLFTLWRKAQERDPYDYSCLSDKIGRNSFTNDGVVCFEKWHNAKPKVLYILKESNVFNEKVKAKTPIEIKGDFWFQKVANGESNGGNIASKIARIQLYFEKEVQNSDKPYNSSFIKNLAYMNINKRGGSAQACDNLLRRYSILYREYILREIELINPQFVVCCGTYEYVMRDIISREMDEDESFYRSNDNIIYIKVKHPSRGSNSEYIDDFSDKYKGALK